jgi:hypothetical protein
MRPNGKIFINLITKIFFIFHVLFNCLNVLAQKSSVELRCKSPNALDLRNDSDGPNLDFS